MAKKLDVTKPGAGSGKGSKTPHIHPHGLHARPSQGSAKNVGNQKSSLSKAYHLYKKFDY